MAVISKLASALGRRDEAPNKELAKQISGKGDKNAVKELVANLSNKNKNIQSDCIKTLDEIGMLDATLTAPYLKEFITLLSSKNNRLQWRAMSAISAVAQENTKAVYAALPKIADAGDKGTVITKDHLVKILVKLGSVKQYTEEAFGLLIGQLQSSPENQFPSYAEQTMALVNDKNKDIFLRTLRARLPGIESDTKRKRVEKVIKKMGVA